MKYYKVLHEDGRAYHGGRGSWPLPSENAPGDWTPFIEKCVPCESGYHVCEADDLLRWLGPAIFEVETRGTHTRAADKTVVQQARLVRRLNWDGKIAAAFALDCATRALNREKRAGRTPDKRLYEAIKVSRKFLKGEATQAEVEWAAWSAAEAAQSAAQSAAEAAWSAAEAAQSAAWSAWAAAWSAQSAQSAAQSAQSAAQSAQSAAQSAAQKWQTKRLFEYLEGKRGV